MMNERIQELLDQCQTPVADVFDVVQCMDTDLEKFAKLIVRECAELAGCNGHVSGFALGDLIKEHFGVNDER